MPPAPLVSVLIPCWGCRDFIRETIESALAQDYRPLEVLVVEDCGDDGTYEAALELRDPRLRVFRNDRNRGQYGNKNRALELASGELVKFLDGDDLLEPGCVTRLVRAREEAGPGVGVVFGNYLLVDERGHVSGTPSVWGIEGRVRGVELLDAVTQRRHIGSFFGNVSAHLFARSALAATGGFPDDNAGPGDLETFLKLLCATDACFVEERLSRYRVRPGSMGSRTFGLRECTDFLRMVQHLEVYFRDQPALPARLRDPNFLAEWKVRAGSHVLFPSYVLKWRRRPNQYDAIRRMYHDAGLAREFRTIMTTDFPLYVAKTLLRRARQAVGLPDDPPVLSRAFATRRGVPVGAPAVPAEGAGIGSE